MKWSSAKTDDLGGRLVLLPDAYLLRPMYDRLTVTEGIAQTTTMFWTFSYANDSQDAGSVEKRFEGKDILEWFKAWCELPSLRRIAHVLSLTGSLDRPDGEIMLEVEWTNSGRSARRQTSPQIPRANAA